MPEGDTIHRSATRLARALVGKTIVRFESGVPELARARLAGREVTRIDARGKHLAVHFDDGHVLLTHMRMTGSWHLYRAGERWWKPPHLARVVLGRPRCGAPIARIVQGPMRRSTYYCPRCQLASAGE
jgi:endonuclease VIII